MLDERSRQELESLRARAFGPNADINSDPNALERLVQLEQVNAASPLVGMVDEQSASTDPDVNVKAETRTDLEPAVAERPDSRSRMSRWWPRVVIGAAGLLLVGLTVAAMLWLTRPEAGAYAVLPAQGTVTSEEAPFDLSGAGGLLDGDPVRYADLLGMFVLSGASSQSGLGVGAQCLVVAVGGDSRSNSSRLGCAPEGLAPVLDVMIDRTATDAAKEEFEAGTTLRFTLTESAVLVYVAPAPEAVPIPELDRDQTEQDIVGLPAGPEQEFLSASTRFVGEVDRFGVFLARPAGYEGTCLILIDSDGQPYDNPGAAYESSATCLPGAGGVGAYADDNTRIAVGSFWSDVSAGETVEVEQISKSVRVIRDAD